MKANQLAVAIVLCLGVSLICAPVHADDQTSLDQTLAEAKTEIQQMHYKQAIRLLEAAQKLFPQNRALRLELAQANLYDGHDKQAIHLLKDILSEEPSNQMAKLELARALGYGGHYQASNQLYRELLAEDSSNESASVGIVRNLIRQNNSTEARENLDLALARHPSSARLQELKTRLAGSTEHGSSEWQRNRLVATETYFADSASNRMWRSWQQLDTDLSHGLASRLQLEERSLWLSGGPTANVMSATEDGRWRLHRLVLVALGGGIVRFADNSSRALYRGEIQSNPRKQLQIAAGFSRSPVTPTFDAAQFDLLSEGWYSRADWDSRSWRVNAHWSHQHFSDHNLVRREGAELFRWMGKSSFSIGAGYEFTDLHFSQPFLHGYFDPNSYQSHLAEGGIRLKYGKFHAEYLARVGAESVSAAPFQTAWEATLRNYATQGNWDLGVEYSYFHLAQNTGAFIAHMPRVRIAYHF